ncbi:MAG: hypothetical protein HC945_01700 [Nitrosarchaeum sp.]|nr:hypothetical protein [Nitrosarchaeum sp.]
MVDVIVLRKSSSVASEVGDESAHETLPVDVFLLWIHSLLDCALVSLLDVLFHLAQTFHLLWTEVFGDVLLVRRVSAKDAIDPARFSSEDMDFCVAHLGDLILFELDFEEFLAFFSSCVTSLVDIAQVGVHGFVKVFGCDCVFTSPGCSRQVRI